MLDRIKGSIFGGAIGDALGYAVEFMQDERIFKKYGERGITDYELTDGVALISDDTQMTLFTAEGILRAKEKYASPSIDEYTEQIYQSYLDWYRTQRQNFDPDFHSDRSSLLHNPGIYTRRAPGNTCLWALSSGKCGSIENKLNLSKGCGGVMRISPIPLMLAKDTSVPIEDIDMISARAAAITHGHDLGFVPAAFLSHVIAKILRGSDIPEAIESARTIIESYPCEYDELAYFNGKIAMAIDLSKEENIDELEAIRYIGEGWVAEETVAIAVYCSLRFPCDFESALIASVNHSGDSDSTGAVTGNILGAYLGYSKIPKKYLENLELSDVLSDISDALAR